MEWFRVRYTVQRWVSSSSGPYLHPDRRYGLCRKYGDGWQLALIDFHHIGAKCREVKTLTTEEAKARLVSIKKDGRRIPATEEQVAQVGEYLLANQES